MKKIPKQKDIFGTKYKIHLISQPNQWMFDNSAIGYTDFENKEIYVLKQNNQDEVYMHEQIHAFLFECGLKRHATDEKLVEILTEIFKRIGKN